ncbi:hypothetical protein [Shewanella kaireitica]|uniref:hypothetical protein n=1 Tax=Shewanella kaireitica TaxID=212021 RepID=UPI00200CF1E7|nr:hypothetical protein [Shewanella kaireitica]MCL1093566.1 hypothetical protein [Shewanella kaireitica]
MKSFRIMLAIGLILFGIIELSVQSISLWWPISSLIVGVAFLLSCVSFKSNNQRGDWLGGDSSSWNSSNGSDSGGE